MLTRRLIPSLLVSGGRLVKGVRFTGYKDAGQPDTTARAHNAQGADELILLDVDASRQRRATDLATIRKVAAECYMPLTVGGGIRSVDDARACMDAGADKLCVTTTALDDPDLIGRLARVFGTQAVVLGIDILGDDETARLYDHRSGKAVASLHPWEWLRRGVGLGAGEIRLAAVDREGTRRGMDLSLLSRAQALVNVPVIVEGGAGTLDHLGEAMSAGADGVAVGTMLVFSDNNLVKIKRYLAAAGHDMRIA